MNLDGIYKKSPVPLNESKAEIVEKEDSGRIDGKVITHKTKTMEPSEKRCIPEPILEQSKSESLVQSLEKIMEPKESHLADVGLIAEDRVKEEGIDIQQEKLKHDSRIEPLKARASKVDEEAKNSKVSTIIERICRQPLSDVSITNIENILTRLERNPKSQIPIQDLNAILMEPFKQKVKDISTATGEIAELCQNDKEIIINERAKFIASLLINDDGKINIEFIDIIPKSYLKSSSSKHDQVLKNTLEAIKSDLELRQLLEDLQEPNSDPNVQSVVKATLGLDPETQLTAIHSKQAVLSAMLTDIRQGQMGSCFATAVAIKVHDQNPKQVAEELKQIIETGKFVKGEAGKSRTFHVPKINTH